MNKRIWKFSLPVEDDVTITMPAGAQVLTVQIQKGQPCIWALVDTDMRPVRRRFHWRGTGNPFGDELRRYCGTVQMHDGLGVFHLFEGVCAP